MESKDNQENLPFDSATDKGGGTPTQERTETDNVPPGSRIRLISMTPEDIPNVYQQDSHGGSPGVRCMVCTSSIDIRGKDRQYVVRCEKCNEATPIRVPPTDKKYVRCICNCLLICRAGALRIICPRQDCHRILDIGHSQTGNQVPKRVEGMVRVACVFCDRNFLFNTLEKKLALCPHCSKKSAVGKTYSVRCGTVFMTVSVIVCIIASIIVGYTYKQAEQSPGFYVLYACLYLITVLLFLRSLYYFLMPVSTILGPF